jgi:hypothetical protein
MGTELDLDAFDDAGLWDLAAAVAAEQRRRLLEAGDSAAAVETGFERGFDAKGHAREPVIDHGFLVCYGSVVEKSATSHDCRFVHVEDSWVWEWPDTICDDVRKVPDRSRQHQRSVTLLVPVEGLEIDVVTSQMRQGVHRMIKTTSYRVRSGALEVVKTRAVSDVHHRR